MMNPSRRTVECDYSALPVHMIEGARLYIERGIEPGGFLLAVLSNDLVGAHSRADDINAARMHGWVAWLYNDCPSLAWGSREKVAAWLKMHAEGAGSPADADFRDHVAGRSADMG